MERTAGRVWAAAGLLLASSLATFAAGWRLRRDPEDGELVDWSFFFVGWSLWEYAACALLVAAAGCALAAARLRQQ